MTSSGGGGGEPALNPKAKSSLGTAASGGAVFQKLRATNPEKKSIGSTATVELTMLAEAPPRTEFPTVASAFCAAHMSPSDLPAALRERLALRRISGVVRNSLAKHVSRPLADSNRSREVIRQRGDMLLSTQWQLGRGLHVKRRVGRV